MANSSGQLAKCMETKAESENNDCVDDSCAGFPFINKIWIVAESSEIVLKMFAFLPVVSWGIMGNFALIYIIAKNRFLRSPTNLLVANMAIADLLSLLIHPWVFLVYDFFQNYQLGKFGCKIEGAIECALLLTSVMSLAAISYDRLTLIVLPRETRLTRYGAKILILVIWLFGILIASPLYVFRIYKERIWKDFHETYCTENIFAINIYWHVIITMMVWLPLSVMSVCYMCIFVKLANYERRVQKQVKSIVQVHYKAKVAKTMFTVLLVFIVCHIPFSALIFYRNYLLKHQLTVSPSVQNQTDGLWHGLWFASKYLIFVNAGLNPVIYGLMNEKFCKLFRATPVVKWIFVSNVKKRIEVKSTKETQVETKSPNNHRKIFTIFNPLLFLSRSNNKMIVISEEKNVTII